MITIGFMSKEKVKLTIEFDNQETLENFASWLCNQGEQDYWEYMRIKETYENGNITAVEIDYHNQDKTKDKSDSSRYKKFMADNTIRTTSGRLSENEVQEEDEDEYDED